MVRGKVVSYFDCDTHFFSYKHKFYKHIQAEKLLSTQLIHQELFLSISQAQAPKMVFIKDKVCIWFVSLSPIWFVSLSLLSVLSLSSGLFPCLALTITHAHSLDPVINLPHFISQCYPMLRIRTIPSWTCQSLEFLCCLPNRIMPFKVSR